MSLPVTFRRVASAEFIEAATQYEAQRANLGAEFIAEIDRCVALAAEQPLLFAAVHNDIRRITVHRFPFCIYFRAEENRIVVLAVFHSRRNPSIWQRRT
ncbi:MAG: type II toxin-antitoxin system RelE/ParE family toxin [Gammaproteobacteria bacterium]|nr:type II toxin-antitoxin system RelE/ParE family toxin [Gammaproteobacteria bacterium]